VSKKRRMCEALWEMCRVPERMAGTLGGVGSPRKLRLLACALARHAPFAPDGLTVYDLLPEFHWSVGLPTLAVADCRAVVTAAERQADGQAEPDEWAAAATQARYAVWSAEADTFRYDSETYPGSYFRYAAASLLEHTTETDPARQARYMFAYRRYGDRGLAAFHPVHGAAACRLTRDVFGNPFRPVTFDPTWRTADALGLARAAYEDRAFERLPMLADALMDAGCADEDILSHCRGGGPHVRGCWVVDLVLGKE
jgi:hypothetical protein